MFDNLQAESKRGQHCNLSLLFYLAFPTYFWFLHPSSTTSLAPSQRARIPPSRILARELWPICGLLRGLVPSDGK
ncbi:hypothetical protein VN97_g2706 [Penicillium thymicola]|uniref:Uncharacterized protein n=1 Tax=Penicillium thymicola TaxID=293382 RepID=A0AAI9TNI8_PENTH|nr:hypothetical protein VN97_g2706 [Penicillium thymicola]